MAKKSPWKLKELAFREHLELDQDMEMFFTLPRSPPPLKNINPVGSMVRNLKDRDPLSVLFHVGKI